MNRGGLSEGEERGGEVGCAWLTVGAVDGQRPTMLGGERTAGERGMREG